MIFPHFGTVLGVGVIQGFLDLVRLGFCEGESILTVKETVHSRTRYGVHEQYEPNSCLGRISREVDRVREWSPVVRQSLKPRKQRQYNLEIRRYVSGKNAERYMEFLRQKVDTLPW